jgi:uncharacterized repeat protein (TIGR01451 family)
MVTNTGNVTLSNLSLNDNLIGNIKLSVSSLAPGASTTATGAYAITQSMIDAGAPITNIATATGTPPTGPKVTAYAQATVTIGTACPSIAVTKKANPTSVCAPGNVTYTYTVTNTGNVTLSNLSLNDNLIGNIKLSVSSLAPGASTTATGTYSVTQSMIDAGKSITNVATATGTPPAGAKYNVTATAQATVTIGTAGPSIAVTKKANPTSVSAPGNVTYTYTVTNTGNVTLSNLSLNDNLIGNIKLNVSSLAPGASTTATGTYSITQSMIDNGSPITNIATAAGTPPTGPKVTATAQATVTIGKACPSISVTKKANPTSVSEPGTVTYTYTVTNTGNVTLSPLTLNDNLIGNIKLSVSSLAPGASTTATATYNITQSMINAGKSITNIATATGTPPTGTKNNVTATAQATVTINQPTHQGCPGPCSMWENWNCQTNYNQQQICSWLGNIDSTSKWFKSGPCTTQDMINCLTNGQNSNPQQGFVSEYLAFNLNINDGCYNPASSYDISQFDPGNYLGLSNPKSSTISQIFNAIEGKYGSSISNNQYGIMQSVCNYINNIG